VQHEEASFLAVDIRDHPDPFEVVIAGEIDITNVDEIVALATHSWNGHGTVVFDISGLTFLGSTGLRAFNIVAVSANKFRCVDGSAIVERVLRVSGLDAWLDEI
jgi:anti-anti-sigma factor